MERFGTVPEVKMSRGKISRFSKEIFQKNLKPVHLTTHTYTELYTEERRNIRMPLWKNSDHWKQKWALNCPRVGRKEGHWPDEWPERGF